MAAEEHIAAAAHTIAHTTAVLVAAVHKVVVGGSGSS
jgi:hypothetical protein